MGSAAGTSPGRLVDTDDNFNIISEWGYCRHCQHPGRKFQSSWTHCWLEEKHHSDVWFCYSSHNPEAIAWYCIVHNNTLRLWNLDSRTIISTTITIPNVSIAQTQNNTLTNKRYLRAATSKTSNSSLETTNLPHLLQRLPSAKSGSSTLSDMIRMDSSRAALWPRTECRKCDCHIVNISLWSWKAQITYISSFRHYQGWKVCVLHPHHRQPCCSSWYLGFEQCQTTWWPCHYSTDYWSPLHQNDTRSETHRRHWLRRADWRDRANQYTCWFQGVIYWH